MLYIIIILSLLLILIGVVGGVSRFVYSLLMFRLTKYLNKKYAENEEELQAMRERGEEMTNHLLEIQRKANRTPEDIIGDMEDDRAKRDQEWENRRLKEVQQLYTLIEKFNDRLCITEEEYNNIPNLTDLEIGQLKLALLRRRRGRKENKS